MIAKQTCQRRQKTKMVSRIMYSPCKFHVIVFINTFKLRTTMAYCRYGRVCRRVKLRICMICTFSFGNISHITLYAQLEIVWKVSKLLRKYWGKYGQSSFYLIICITSDSIIVERIFLVQWKVSILTNILPNILKIAFIVIGIW